MCRSCSVSVVLGVDMSSEIVYHHTVSRVACHKASAPALYAWMWQIGPSNCYESGTNRRSRSWQLAAFGSREQVLRTAIYFAGDCEGGMLKYRSANGFVKPETFIASVRGLLKRADRADQPAMQFRGHGLQLTLVQRDTMGSITERYRIDAVEEFLNAVPDYLDVRVVPGSRFGVVVGPEMR